MYYWKWQVSFIQLSFPIILFVFEISIFLYHALRMDYLWVINIKWKRNAFLDVVLEVKGRLEYCFFSKSKCKLQLRMEYGNVLHNSAWNSRVVAAYVINESWQNIIQWIACVYYTPFPCHILSCHYHLQMLLVLCL